LSGAVGEGETALPARCTCVLASVGGVCNATNWLAQPCA
jgi:hypothetical protein